MSSSKGPTGTDTVMMTATVMKTGTRLVTSTTTILSTVTVPTISGFTPLASASDYVSRKRSLSKRALHRRNKWWEWEDVWLNDRGRVMPEPKLKEIDGPCTIKIDPDDKKHHVEPAQFPSMVLCYKVLKISKTRDAIRCRQWTRTITLAQKTTTRHSSIRVLVINTVTKADATVTADDHPTTTKTLTETTTTSTTTIVETGTSRVCAFVVVNHLPTIITI
jgi:hypothetical protein